MIRQHKYEGKTFKLRRSAQARISAAMSAMNGVPFEPQVTFLIATTEDDRFYPVAVLGNDAALHSARWLAQEGICCIN